MRSINKHTPQRTCIACRKVRPKRELIRLVRLADGSIEADARGRKVGRGAYLCPELECWDIGLKRSRLEHALHTSLTQDNREQLIGYGKTLEMAENKLGSS